MQELLEAGVHFGHQVRRGNPRMKPFIYGAREGVHILDLAQSEKLLREACEYVYKLGKEGKVMLFVGTKKQAGPIVEESAKKATSMYLTEKWVAGFLTNFDEISKNIKKLKDLKEQKEKGQLAKYTKKEQLLIDRKITKLESIFKGVLEISGMPDAVFIVDTVSDETAAKECVRMGVKVVAIADTNSNPLLIDYPIPGNDDAIKSIKILTEAIANSYEAGKKDAGKTDAQVAKEEKEVAKESKKKSKKEDLPAGRQENGPEEVEIAEELLAEVAAVEEEVEKKAVKEAERIIE